jgi:hypothetical protein
LAARPEFIVGRDPRGELDPFPMLRTLYVTHGGRGISHSAHFHRIRREVGDS